MPLSGGERASERSAINLHLIAFARAAPPACAVCSPRTRRLYHCTVVRRALIFSRKGKGRKRGSRGSNWDRGRGIGEGSGILMVADYAADFTRLFFPPSPPRHYVQDKRKSHFIPPRKTEGRWEGESGWVMIPANRHVRERSAEPQMGFPFPFPFEIRDTDAAEVAPFLKRT